MRVWVTRTQPGADRTADRLRALGHEPVVRPVLEVRAVPCRAELEGIAAVAFTSVNGVEAFASGSAERRLPVFAVGRATALAAVAEGFADVRSANGDVQALARLIAAHPPAGAVLHAAGRPRAGDLEGDLTAAGLTARTAELYETVPTSASPPWDVDAVLVHSPEAARSLSRLAGFWRVAWLCLSPAVAGALGRPPGARIAARPDDASLLARLDA